MRPIFPASVGSKSLAAIVIAALLTGPIAEARGAPRARGGVSEARAEAARDRFAEGLKLYAKKHYGQALASFIQAYALTKVPAILLNLGRTSLKLGRPLDAARYFEQFLRESGERTPLQTSLAQKGIAEAREKLGRIEVKAPDGAELSVDGEVVGRAPLADAVDVLPGSHEVKMTTPEESKTSTVRVAEGDRVAVKLVPSRPSPQPQVAVVEPVEPERPRDIAPETTRDEAPPQEPGIFSVPTSTAPVYVAGGVALVALTTAAILGGIRQNADRNRSTAEDALTRNGKDLGACSVATPDPSIAGTCSSLSGAIRALDQTGPPFIGSLVVGVGAGAFALGWYFFAPKAGAGSKSGSLHPSIIATPGRYTASVAAEF